MRSGTAARRTFHWTRPLCGIVDGLWNGAYVRGPVVNSVADRRGTESSGDVGRGHNVVIR